MINTVNKEIAAIVVCFNPNLTDLYSMVSKLVYQVNHVYIVDNTEHNQNNELKYVIGSFNKQLTYMPQYKNLGIGAAQNRGIDLAIHDGHTYVLILDQDSQVPDGFTFSMYSGIKELEKQGKSVACLGPNLFNRDTGIKYSSKINDLRSKNDKYEEVLSIISSGSIISKLAYEVTGGMDVDLFIDSVDFEWCWRAKSLGYGTYIAKQVYLGHRVGEGDISVLGLFNLQRPQPFRHYYQFRNRVILMKRSYTPLYFKIRSVILMPIEFFIYSLLVYPRIKRFKMMSIGLFDGLRNKKGKFNE